MKNRIWKAACVVVLAAVSIVCSPCYAALYQVEDVQFTFGQGQYYQGATQQFAFSQTALTGDLSILKSIGETNYEYSIHNAVVTFSNASLLSAPGTFAGGITLTITGQLIDNASSASLASGTLLTATMQEASWDLTEPFDDYVYGGGSFVPTGGLLKSGLAAGNDVIQMTDFAMGFFAIGTFSGSFGSQNVSAIQSSVQLHSDVVPEPATIAILSLGMVCLARRQKKA